MKLVKSIKINDRRYAHPNFRVCLLLFAIFICSSFLTSFAHADSVSSNLNVKLEGNSISKSSSDIIFAPSVNTEYTFNTIVTNTSDRELEVKSFVSQGISKEQNIDYTIEDNDKLLNSKYDITHYAKISSDNIDLSKSFKLDPKQSRIIHITINVPTTFKGEVLGGVNFSEDLSETENKNTVNTKQVYQKIIVIRLTGESAESQVRQDYKQFSFIDSSKSVLLSYYNYNNNSKIIYADKGTYELLDPNQKVIGEGQLNNKTVLTPFTKTQMRVGLNDKLSLTPGKYTFITNIEGRKTIYYFTYKKAEIQKVIQQASNKVIVKSNNSYLIFSLLVLIIIMMVIVLIIIYKLRKLKK